MGWFGQSFRIDGRSTKIKQNKRRKRKKKKVPMACYLNVTTPKWSFFFSLLLSLCV